MSTKAKSVLKKWQEFYSEYGQYDGMGDSVTSDHTEEERLRAYVAWGRRFTWKYSLDALLRDTEEALT